MHDETGLRAAGTDGQDMVQTVNTGETSAPTTEDIPDPTPDQAQRAAAPGTSHAPFMRTLLKQFSEEFTVEVEPLIAPIHHATDTLTGASADLGVRALLPDLRDLLHHVRVLFEKVAGQQAYVLIFGPLKSGKSTFMNAICSTYVSEVTSLPAYPCIVNVTHDTTPSFTVTRYDGCSERYTEQSAVYDVVQQAHSDLMATIRRVEDDGEQFDPSVHMPHSIRKIDVRLPTGDLAESGAVLVDTPGLYSRMKFGYDRLTRDFRNAAACAIFIVKTDNLFLEQVFTEFHELLELFSRVFLIVNLDTAKKDLDPTGDLVPSLECDDPGRIIDAFTDLSMSAPLKAAADAGRLRIYPVDLLEAASARIRGAAAPRADIHRPDGHEKFETLLADLTDYLNSSEYLRAFLSDSLRRARSLLEDLGRLTRHETVGALADEAESLRRAHTETVAQRQAVERLKDIDWTKQSAALHRFLVTRSQEESGDVRRITGHALVGAIDTWFDNDLSLAALRDEEVAPLLNTCRKQFIHYLRGEMAQQLPGMRGGVAVTDDTLADAGLVDIDLGALARAAMEDATAAATLAPVESDLSGEHIPVRRGFWDWLMMRSKPSVRRRLFGPATSPTKRISPTTKDKRIGEAGRAKMQELAAEQFDSLLADAITRLPEELVTSYVANLSGPLAGQIQTRDEQTAARLTEIDAKLAEAERIIAELEALGGHAERVALAVAELEGRFCPENDKEPQAEQADQPDAAQETDEFDDLYAPYVAEASAMPETPADEPAEAEADDDEPASPVDQAAEQADTPREDDESDDLYRPHAAEATDTPADGDQTEPAHDADRDEVIAEPGDQPAPDDGEPDIAAPDETWAPTGAEMQDLPEPTDEMDTEVDIEPIARGDDPADDQPVDTDPPPPI